MGWPLAWFNASSEAGRLISIKVLMRIPRNSPRIEAILSILQFTADSLWKYRSISPPPSLLLFLLSDYYLNRLLYNFYDIARVCFIFYDSCLALNILYSINSSLFEFFFAALSFLSFSFILVFCLFLSFVTAATLELIPHLRVQDLCKTNPSKFWSFLWFQANFLFRFFSLLLSLIFCWGPLFNLNLFTLKFNIW